MAQLQMNVCSSRLEDQEEIFFNQKKRAAQGAVSAELGEFKRIKFSLQRSFRLDPVKFSDVNMSGVTNKNI